MELLVGAIQAGEVVEPVLDSDKGIDKRAMFQAQGMLWQKEQSH